MEAVKFLFALLNPASLMPDLRDQVLEPSRRSYCKFSVCAAPSPQLRGVSVLAATWFRTKKPYLNELSLQCEYVGKLAVLGTSPGPSAPITATGGPCGDLEENGP